MRFARRIIITILAGLLLIVAACWGYWTYRQYRAGQTPVPRDATSLVRIHIDGIIRDIAWNALSNGTSYPDTAVAHPAFRTKQLQKLQMPIPASVFLYQVDHPLRSEFPDVYFGSLAVDDSTGMAAWLRDNLAMDITIGTQGTIASTSHAVAIIRPDRMLLALSPTKLNADRSALVDVLANVLQEYGGAIAVSESHLGDILHDNGQLAGRGAREFSIGFETGIITFSVPNALASPLRQLEPTPHFSDSNAVSLWVQDSLTNFLSNKTIRIGSYTVQGDSLLRHYGGRMVLEWKSTTTQQDTVVNYDYDDNFELMEMQEVIEKAVPEIYWSVQADTAFIGYLQHCGVMEPSGTAVAGGAFPLYKLGTSPLPTDYVQFHTATEARELPPPADQDRTALYLRVDFNRLQVPELPERLVPFREAANILELTGRPTSTGSITIRGTLRMKNHLVHSLVQLLNLI